MSQHLDYFLALVFYCQDASATSASCTDANIDLATEDLTAYSAIISDYDVSSNKSHASRLVFLCC